MTTKGSVDYNYTNEDDALIINTVIAFTAEGRMLQDAFTELVGLLPNRRTVDGLGYRWHAKLKKQPGVKDKLDAAKPQKKQEPKKPAVVVDHKNRHEIFSNMVKSIDAALNLGLSDQEEITALKHDNNRLGAENKALKIILSELDELRTENAALRQMKADYAEMSRVFHIARKLMLNEPVDIGGHVFDMDTNGNLERRKENGRS